MKEFLQFLAKFRIVNMMIDQQHTAGSVVVLRLYRLDPLLTDTRNGITDKLEKTMN